ncbi:MAG: hypothetical protein SFV23_24230 [Planctomycetaceae bacterium]|nr:hypothetical protein [Planctomycetaceae bacterium]
MANSPRVRTQFDVAAPAVSLALADRVADPTSRASSAEAADRWQKFFESGKAKPETVRNLVAELSEAKKSDEVVVLLEQALIAGQSQPWMYEVLALSMEIAGRPRSEIERVLQSTRDLVPADADSLLFLAAYLARFERFAQALRCCRQAAELEPNRAEPYAEALRFARRAKDLEAQAWAAVGILAFAWGPRQGPLRDDAAGTVSDVRQAWRAQGRWKEIAAFEAAVAQAERVDLRLRVEWSGAGDLDLTVIEPQGTTCSRRQPYSPGGGIFAHDGAGPAAADCFDEYVCPIAWSGEYRVRVTRSWGNIVGKRATLVVTRNGQREVFPIQISSDECETRVLLKNGRRQEAASPQPVSRRDASKRPVRQTVLQQLAPSGQTQPFNTGAVPVGGGVGYQPVVQFFNEGISMTALATVSGDRRYVRITTTPIFSDITDVFTFSFQR